MIYTRRGFLEAATALIAAPAIVRAASLDKLVVRRTLRFHPDVFIFSMVPIGKGQWTYSLDSGLWRMAPLLANITDNTQRIKHV